MRDAGVAHAVRSAASQGGVAMSSAIDGEYAPMQQRVIDALRTIFDPELPVNIYDLGLIYDLQVDEDEGRVMIQMSRPGTPCGSWPISRSAAEDAVSWL